MKTETQDNLQAESTQIDVPEVKALEKMIKAEEAKAAAVAEAEAAEQAAESGEPEPMTLADVDNQGLRMGAAVAVGFAETMLKMKAPHLSLDAELKEKLIDKTVPVMRKHGGSGELPWWYVKYKEEIELGVVIASAAWSLNMQNKAYLAEQQQQQQQQAQAA